MGSIISNTYTVTGFSLLISYNQLALDFVPVQVSDFQFWKQQQRGVLK
jgi:hypothetical protein